MDIVQGVNDAEIKDPYMGIEVKDVDQVKHVLGTPQGCG